MDVNVKLFIFYEDISKDQGDCKRQTMISSLPVKASFIFFYEMKLDSIKGRLSMSMGGGCHKLTKIA